MLDGFLPHIGCANTRTIRERRKRMLAKTCAEKFFTGAFGKIYQKEFVEQLEAMREQTNATSLNQTAQFEFDAEEGETVLSVTLTLRVKSENDEES